MEQQWTKNEQQDENLKVNSDNKKYLIEENGVFYGGDYLPKLPDEIELTDLDSSNAEKTVESSDDLPPPPPPENNII